MKSDYIHMRADEGLKTRVQAASRFSGIPMSEIMRRAVAAFLPNVEEKRPRRKAT